MYREFRLLWFGLAAWALPFALSLAAAPLREAEDPLYGTVRTLVVTGLGLAFLARYLRRRSPPLLREGQRAGLALLAISLVADFVLRVAGVLTDPLPVYVRDVALAYAVYPMIGAAMGWLVDRRRRSSRGDRSVAAESPRPVLTPTIPEPPELT